MSGTGYLFVALSASLALGGVQAQESSTAPPSDPVLAEMDGYKFTQKEYDKILQMLPESTRRQIQDPESKAQLVKSWMELMAFHADAQATSITTDPALQQRLEFVTRQLVVEEYRTRLVKEVTVNDDEVAAFYEENKEKYKRPPMVKASHILVGTEEEAKQVKQSLSAGAEFAALAKERSKDTTNKDNGGDLGWLVPGRLAPAFEQAAFALEVGQLSDPVQTNYGWHIIQVSEKREPGYQEFSQIKQMLSQQALAKKQQQVVAEATQNLLKKYHVTIH